VRKIPKIEKRSIIVGIGVPSRLGHFALSS